MGTGEGRRGVGEGRRGVGEGGCRRGTHLILVSDSQQGEIKT